MHRVAIDPLQNSIGNTSETILEDGITVKTKKKLLMKRFGKLMKV